MSAPTIYRTKGGVLVTIKGTTMFRHRSSRMLLKGDAYRVDTGGRHGWLWMHLLKAVTP